MADPTYRAAHPEEFFCPAGGRWYMCESGTKFVGCCVADPCTNACHGDSLRPAGRSIALDSQSPGGSCGGQTPFWTCEQAPTFWGCCNKDPCMNNSTCPEGKLEPTYWDRPDQYEYFKNLNILLSSTAPRSMSSTSPTSSAGGSGSSSSRGAVIGGAIGGTLGFLAIVGMVVFLLWRRKRAVPAEEPSASPMEENKPAGELASPISVGTATLLCFWDVNGASPPQQTWAHSHPEVSGEDTNNSPRSPFTELHSKSSLARIAELPGAPAAKELGTSEVTPKPSQTGSDSDRMKTPTLGVVHEPRNSTEKH